MHDTKFFKNTNLESESTPINMIELGYTLWQKIAISLWTLATFIVAALSYLCYLRIDEGKDVFTRVSFETMSNLDFDLAKTHFDIHYFPIIQYGGAALCVYLGYRLIKAAVPRDVRVHPVRSTIERTGPARKP